ncbi:outer membrane lipoprotein-sorting protein [Marispirochaeta aestuarii]|uniref:outer membrane lipoprotein-sorting protein n=1 Tax=Marispirochaeta aestuarii TaxID=1963862 RepID=UPI0029C64ECC|nr:outer membrane lipoprotein-sorting protein [Marispirochaeta aestuarii]
MSKMKALFVMLVCASAVWPETALEIIRRVDERQYSKTSEQTMLMRVYPSMASDSGLREFRISSVSRGNDETFMVFEEPRTIKGMKILSRGDDRWVHFPSTGRVRKIVGESKKQSVQGVGGDFSYEDLGGGTLEEDYRTRLLDESGSKYIIEGIPVQDDSAYTRVVFEIEKGSYRILKMEFHTEKEGHLKDLFFRDYTVMGGREIAGSMEMINLERERRTKVLILEARFDRAVDEKLFNPTRFYR